MNKTTGVLTAAAAAALLSISPVAAQSNGGSGAEVEAWLGLNDPERLEATETFRTMEPAPSDVTFDARVGAVVPETARMETVPPEVVEVAPATEGYKYVALADDRIAIVHPESYEIVEILE